MTNNDVMALTAFLPGSQLAGHTIGNKNTTQLLYCTHGSDEHIKTYYSTARSICTGPPAGGRMGGGQLKHFDFKTTIIKVFSE